ncbi:DUF4177 domain-containing protein [Eisenbergiella tayi]|uniref:DUF4177 domain-containing protein n=1 Tax=Eisenbergiella tayi TaxID=1432052 RepID=UPI000849492B|nr:DUF4177 domain-containing protein [Eisenbergiella tayi]ODR34935.1 hypothetical protein BEI60_17705 [Eisenbergiella tayi]
MWQYQFIRIELSTWVSYAPKNDYHTIILEMGQNGWELVQIFAPPVGVSGHCNYFELIFKKFVEGERINSKDRPTA